MHPITYAPERAYVLRVLFRDFLGLDFVAEASDRVDTQITLCGDHGDRKLVIADQLFQTPESKWLTPLSLPVPPLPMWDLGTVPFGIQSCFPEVPLLFMNQTSDGPVCIPNGETIHLNLDVFGSVFFLLTRYEEVTVRKRDKYGRFAWNDSVLAFDDLLCRPLANEYLEILWGAMSYLWPGLRRQERSFRMLVSHDVDWPLYSRGRSHVEVIRSVAGDMLIRRSATQAVRRLIAHVNCTLSGNWSSDIYNTFNFLMTESEQSNLQSAFYFITGHTAGTVDGNYSMTDPWIQQLMREIYHRGHEIGLHPSFNSYQDATQIAKEFSVLRDVAAEQGILQEAWGGRQHYLRWEADTTWRHWSAAGLSYDSSVGFAERAGFRAGICFEYQAFSLGERRPLPILERPLIAMDVSVLGKQYMNQNADEAFETFAELKAICKAYHGDFTLLWHNSELWGHGRTELYRAILRH